MTNRYITLAHLREHYACSRQCAEFERRFGESVLITRELCKSVACVFDWGWAVKHLLSDAARRAYEKAVTPVCEEAVASVWRAHEEEAVAAAWRACLEVKAIAFADAYNSEENQS